MDDDRILTADEAALVLGVSRNKLYKLVSARIIRTTKAGIRLGDLRKPE